MAEKLRAAGAGIPAFYTRTGVGIVVQDGKEIRNFDGKDYLLEMALHADIALIKAYKADKAGNLVFRKTARNINPDCAVAGKITIAEVEQLVEIGDLDPDEIHLPGIYIDRIVVNANLTKHIEIRTVKTKTV
jgi:3-oxoacid CoA-transferase subunit A